jgi:hypothetical protein
VNFGCPRAQECCGQAQSVTSIVTLRCYTQVIMPASTHAFPVVGGSARAERHCKARQGRRGKTAPTFELTFTVVRFLETVDRLRRKSLVTTAVLCLFVVAEEEIAVLSALPLKLMDGTLAPFPLMDAGGVALIRYSMAWLPFATKQTV